MAIVIVICGTIVLMWFGLLWVAYKLRKPKAQEKPGKVSVH